MAPDLGVWAQVSVHRDCHVQFEKSLYSVPFSLVGQRLWLRATNTTITIFKDHHLAATHLRARSAATWRTVREHLPPRANCSSPMIGPGVPNRRCASGRRARSCLSICWATASWSDCAPHRECCAWPAATAPHDSKPRAPGPWRTTVLTTARFERSSWVGMTCRSSRPIRHRL